VIVLAGVDLVNDHEVAGFFVKRSLPAGTRLITVDTQANPLAPQAYLALKVSKDSEAALFSAVAAGLAGKIPVGRRPAASRRTQCTPW